MTMGLKFRRFVAEGALDAFPKLKFSTGEGAFEIREAFPPKIFKFRDKGMELLNALSEIVDRKRLRPRPL